MHRLHSVLSVAHKEFTSTSRRSTRHRCLRLQDELNGASSELARYYSTFQDSPERAFASYLITGAPLPLAHDEDHGMDANDGRADTSESSENVVAVQMSLANEDVLEGALHLSE